MKDQPLGPRQADATHWRCRRLDDEGDRKGTQLVWDENGIRVGEWPIKSCSPETISERWGPGRYVVDYMRIDESGKRKPRGTSRLLHVTGRSVVTAEQPSLQPQLPTTPAPSPAVAMLPDGLAGAFSLMAFLEEKSERARAAAAAEARYAIERNAAETKATLERYRADMERAAADAKAAQERNAAEQKAAQEKYKADLEFQLERERLASKERIAQIEAQSRAAPARGPHFDPEKLAQRIGEVVGDRVQEALDEQYESADLVPAAPAAPDNTAAMVAALKDTLAPIISLVVAKLASGATVPETALPPIAGGNGGNGGKDPNGQPN